MSVEAALQAICGPRWDQHHPAQWQGPVSMVEAFRVQLGRRECSPRSPNFWLRVNTTSG